MRIARFAIVLLVSCSALFAQTPPSVSPRTKLQTQLRGELVDKVFLINNFYQGGFLRYDRTGKLKVPAPVGAWTMARFEIRQLFLHPSRLDLQGVRVVDVYEKNSPKFAMVPTNSVLAMSIDLPPGELTLKTVMDLLGKVFVHSNPDLIRLVPDYWRAYVMKRVQKTDAGYCIEGSRFRSADGKIHDCVSGEIVTDGDSTSASEVPFVVGGDVHPPQAISTPEPVYNAVARQAKLQGSTILLLVVGEDGSPKNIQIVKPIGIGLDDEAVKAVDLWKFHPAMLNGRAVPVRIKVNVDFKLP